MRIVEQIRIARESRCPIIVLEYEGGDPEWHDTVDSIMQALHGYDLHAVAEKDEDDGSDVLMWVCGEREWDGTFILTGVNLDACVKRTAEGFGTVARKSHKI